ncbi:MAG: phage baseplate assembly protein V [Burkholderiales bacterium]|nr:phage baseplate assembly protein V [Burkholderiales bacterium]
MAVSAPPGIAVYAATVTDARDPYGEMRVKVSVPAILGSREVWAWPLVRAPGAALPEAGSAVLVMFEGGDLEAPVWAAARRP